MNKYPRNPPVCEKCHRPAATSLITLAPVNDNPPALWLCGSCKRKAQAELVAWTKRHQPKPLPRLTVGGTTRQRLLLRDGGCCAYCGEGLELEAATLDHVLPKSRGGTRAQSNLVIACKPCNAKKGNRTPEEAGMPLRVALKSRQQEGLRLLRPFWELAQEDRYGSTRPLALSYGAGC